MEVVRSLTRYRMFWAVCFYAVLFIGIGVWYALHQRRLRLRLQGGEYPGHYQGVTLDNETGTLHLLQFGAAIPKGISNRLRSFNSAEEVVEYVYRQYDEALFRRLVIHRADVEATTEFVRAEGESDDDALGRLAQLMPLPVAQPWEIADAPRPKL